MIKEKGLKGDCGKNAYPAADTYAWFITDIQLVFFFSDE